jgi:hypothetical protein
MSRSFLSVPPANLAAGGFWLLIGVVVLFGAASLPPAEGGGIGPASFPRALGILLIVLVLFYWAKARKAGEAAAKEDEEDKDRGSKRMTQLILLSFAAALLLETLGALIALLLFCGIELRWIEGYRWKKVIAVSLILGGGIWFSFTRFLGVNMPRGLLDWFNIM